MKTYMFVSLRATSLSLHANWRTQSSMIKVVEWWEYRARNCRNQIGAFASNVKQVANLLRAYVNSASYPQRNWK